MYIYYTNLDTFLFSDIYWKFPFQKWNVTKDYYTSVHKKEILSFFVNYMVLQI